ARDGGLGQYWFDQTAYQAIGPVPVASALCGLALGAAAGLALGRAVPAIAATSLLAYALYQGALLLRPHLLPSLLTTAPSRGVPGIPPVPQGAWIIDSGYQ